MPPDFLQVERRAARPRSVGTTHVIDGGIPAGAVPDVLDAVGPLVDIWKFGWGTAYLDPGLATKLALLEEHGVAACPGGTLLEIAWLQGQEDAFFDWAAAQGFAHVEVSNGASGMPLAEKRRLIAAAGARFVVLSEVGSKDPEVPVSPQAWADEAFGDLRAGARWILAEGRESGTVGLYDRDGQVREDVVDALVGMVGPARLIFEAPRKGQQAWFVRRLGTDVNLGNVAVGDVLAVEALRLGLRADTIDRHVTRSLDRGAAG